jgi:O-antigen/teichoic acid export membrane protein
LSAVRAVAKNTAALFAAEAISQVLRVVYYAILVRYIRPEGLGTISTAQALVSILFVLVSFGFDQLVVRDVARAKTEATAYVNNVTFIRLMLSVLFGVALVLSVQAFRYPAELATITYIYGLAFVLQGLTDTGLAIFQAFEAMEYNLIIRASRDFLNVGLSLLAIYLQYSLMVIVGITAVANLFQLVLGLLLLAKKHTAPRLQVDPRLWKRLILAAMPFALVAVYPVARSQLNTLVLSTTNAVQEVGWFASANTLIGIVMLVPGIFMSAMFPVFSRLSDHLDTSLQIAYRKSFMYLLGLGLAISAGAFLTADQIIPLVLGSGFKMAIPAFKVLAWLPLVGFVGYCNGYLLCAVGKERLFMVTEGLFSLVYAALSFALVPRWGYMGACYAILAPTVVGFGLYSVMCHRLLRLRLPWKMSVAVAVAASLMALCVYCSLRMEVNLVVTVLVISPVVYVGALVALRVLSAEDITLLKQALRLG